LLKENPKGENAEKEKGNTRGVYYNVKKKGGRAINT